MLQLLACAGSFDTEQPFDRSDHNGWHFLLVALLMHCSDTELLLLLLFIPLLLIYLFARYVSSEGVHHLDNVICARTTPGNRMKNHEPRFTGEQTGAVPTMLTLNSSAHTRILGGGRSY